jgi:3D-(3,5/4)-trihydroxycyclohexane-1,2-dione acylhydrolase (decyclizing)
MEYGYSCMGYEIAGGLGVKMARPEQEVIVMVGDGSYLMMNSEIATSVMLGLKLIIVVLDNRGFGCIQRLQLASGSPRFNNMLDDCVADGRRSQPDRLRHACAQPGRRRGACANRGELKAAMAGPRRPTHPGDRHRHHPHPHHGRRRLLVGGGHSRSVCPRRSEPHTPMLAAKQVACLIF